MSCTCWGSAPPSLVTLPVFPGTTGSYANAVSADGMTVVGSVNSGGGGGDAVRWSRASDSAPWSIESVASNADVSGVSADGSVVAGQRSNGQVFRWTRAQGAIDVGNPGDNTRVHGMSADAGAIVGSFEVSGVARAFRWTAAGGFQVLTMPDGSVGGIALATNNDGTVVVGKWGSAPGTYWRAFRWTQGGASQDIGTVSGASTFYSIANGVSLDGVTVVGESSWQSLYKPFVWRSGQTAPIRSMLGDLQIGWSGIALGISGDGRTSVGYYYTATAQFAIVINKWNSGTTLPVLLHSIGVDSPEWAHDTGFTAELLYATGSNFDGTVIVGWGLAANGQDAAYVATIPPPCPVDFDGVQGPNLSDLRSFVDAWFAGSVRGDFNEDGAVTIEDLFAFLSAWLDSPC
jgi:uncharacterized membrane protein